MKSIAFILALALIVIGTLWSVDADHHEKPSKPALESSYRSVRSPGGFIAHNLRFASEDGEPEGRVFIEKDRRVIATLPGVRAVSFSPAKDILLVSENIADDDLKHYLLDIGVGQYTRAEPRKDYVIGSRWVNRAEWSDDGKFLVLFEQPGITDQAPEVITVADKL